MSARQFSKESCNAGDPGSPLGWEDPLEQEMATHASILACRVPRTEEPGGLQPVGSPRVRLSNLHCASLQGPRHTGCTREGALSASVVSVCSHLSASEDRGPFPGGGSPASQQATDASAVDL